MSLSHEHSPSFPPPYIPSHSQVLAAADVELGSNYPMPVISRPDAKANVAYACSVLEKWVRGGGGEEIGAIGALPLPLHDSL